MMWLKKGMGIADMAKPVQATAPAGAAIGAALMTPRGLPMKQGLPPEGQYDTRLTPSQESGYNEALATLQKATGRDYSGDVADYDLPGAYLAGQFTADGRGHMTDQFKKPWHPTFSTDSQYSSPAMPAGQWKKGADGRWTFAPGPANSQYWTADDLARYFEEAEPDVTLLPSTRK